ncbi:MAG: hypothetical protein LBH24_06330, partial [Clostridiales bacterium]|nr:hypothetical protein [Clostridiales bacterium]
MKKKALAVCGAFVLLCCVCVSAVLFAAAADAPEARDEYFLSNQTYLLEGAATVTFNGDEAVAVKNAAFIPKKEGQYVIVYSGTNQTVRVNVYDTVPAITYRLDGALPQSTPAGKEITVPALTAFEVNGQRATGFTVGVYCGGRLVTTRKSDEGFGFTPIEAGGYAVQYAFRNLFMGASVKSYRFTVTDERIIVLPDTLSAEVPLNETADFSA